MVQTKGTASMEGQKLIQTPLWVRVVALSALTAALVVSTIVVVVYIETEKDSWVLAALSVTQVATSGLVVAILLLFSAKDAGAIGLQVRTDRFLRMIAPRAFAFIEFPIAETRKWSEMPVSAKRIFRNLKKSPTEVLVRHNAGENDAYYIVSTPSSGLTFRLQVNVFEITVSYYFPSNEESELESIRGALTWAISRYTDVGGYHASWYWSEEEFDNRTYVSVHLTRNFSDDFLENEKEKLFLVQDIASSTRSLIKECERIGIKLSYQPPN